MEYRIIKCRIYPFNTLGDYKYADIMSLYKGKWIFSKHKNRSTWESQGGHIENGESPLEAAKRELIEEAGAIDFDIEPLCDYWVHAIIDGLELKANGQVYFANVHTLGKIPKESEMEKIFLFDDQPKNLTYPEYAVEVYPLVKKKIEELKINNN
jgi:8-oxo-dGTP diphosphatase